MVRSVHRCNFFPAIRSLYLFYTTPAFNERLNK